MASQRGAQNPKWQISFQSRYLLSAAGVFFIYKVGVEPGDDHRMLSEELADLLRQCPPARLAQVYLRANLGYSPIFNSGQVKEVT